MSLIWVVQDKTCAPHVLLYKLCNESLSMAERHMKIHAICGSHGLEEPKRSCQRLLFLLIESVWLSFQE